MAEEIEDLKEQYTKYFREMEEDNLRQEICDVKDSLEEFRKVDENFAALMRLEENDDWKRFKEMYFTYEKKRLADALTSVAPFREETEKQLQQKLMSIRHLKLFMNNVEIESTGSGQAIKDLEERLEIMNFVAEERGFGDVSCL